MISSIAFRSHDKVRAKLLLTACVSCIALGTGSQAFAQSASAASPADESSGLEDIIVTAQKRSENIQRVPIAITAVALETLDHRQSVSPSL